MAMSVFAVPVTGRPTRCARFNSSGVVSGISEKSIPLSAACLTFPLTRPARADVPVCFFAIFVLPCCVDENQNPTRHRQPKPFQTDFVARMFEVGPFQTVGIFEDSGGL